MVSRDPSVGHFEAASSWGLQDRSRSSTSVPGMASAAAKEGAGRSRRRDPVQVRTTGLSILESDCCHLHRAHEYSCVLLGPRCCEQQDIQDPVLVQLLALQRTGSSFTGHLLDHLPGVFYLYEPLIPVYYAMYGVRDIVSNDIFFNKDGTRR